MKLLSNPTLLRWIARIWGSLILAFLLFFVLGHLFGEDESGNGFQSAKEVIGFICFPVGTMIGLALAYKWERLGGMITTACLIVLFVLMPELLSNLYIWAAVVPGVLYVILGMLKR